MTQPRAARDETGVILIDAQPAFWEYAYGTDEGAMEATMVRLEHLLMLCGWFELPLIATFEHAVKEKGELPARLEALFPAAGGRFVKHTYDLTREAEISSAVQDSGVQQWAVAGAETDVCVLQSVLGLMRLGFEVFLLEDCLFTTEAHPGPALRRMYAAGAVPTTFKSWAYELTRSVDHTPWLDTWVDRGEEGVKAFPEAFGVIEELPEWTPNLDG
jgi:nicotinamidase-related amidase